jgi:hypothetical protein
MNFKALAITAATATSIITAPAVEARGTYAEHGQLGNAIKSTGVVLKFNPMECNERDSFGWYWSGGNEMVICQENRSRYSTAEVQWTEEDLDTLRHEAQHLVQDCMDGSQNGRLGSVYKDPIALAKDVLSRGQIQSIIDTYVEQGASEHIVIMELEAFSVAAMNDPMEQVRDINNFCF